MRARHPVAGRFPDPEAGALRDLGTQLLSDAQPQLRGGRRPHGTPSLAIAERRAGRIGSQGGGAPGGQQQSRGLGAGHRGRHQDHLHPHQG